MKYKMIALERFVELETRGMEESSLCVLKSLNNIIIIKKLKL